MVDTRRLTRLVASVNSRLDLPDDPLVVGLSGGADSASLAHICVELGREVRAVHINHGLRHASLMEGAASEVARGLDIRLDVRTVEVPKGPSPEGQARRVRYAEFEQSTDSESRLLTAHTRDDHVETVIFNLIRGTGPRGLGGIPYYRPPNIFRPLLTVTRAETREIADLAGLPVVDDPMNDDLTLTRNVIRARVIPLLSELNPRLSESIARMAASIASDNAYLDRKAGEVSLLRREGSVALSVGDLFAAARPVADRALKEMLGYAIGADNVSAEGVKKLWSVASGASQAQQFGSDFTATRPGALLVLKGPIEGTDQEPVLLTPGRHRVGSFSFDVLAHDDVCRVTPLSRWSALFPPATHLEATADGGVVSADGERAWIPGEKRMPVAWYEPGSVGYLSVFAREET